MKVKIIASKPIDDACSDIEKYIGREFEAYIDVDGSLMAKVGNGLLLFDGEYKIVEI